MNDVDKLFLAKLNKKTFQTILEAASIAANESNWIRMHRLYNDLKEIEPNFAVHKLGEKTSRNKQIVKLHNKGVTYREIASHYQISSERARQIYVANS